MMGGLAFLSPWFLLGALAVAIPVVLHLFRRRDDPVVPFSAMRFLEQVPIEQARRRRLQDLLLLALRAAALLLLAIGFARPYFQSTTEAAGAAVTVVAVDVSASLGDPARFARVKALALEAVDEAPAGAAVALVRFAGQADLLVEPGPDRQAARAAIGRLTPSAGPTRYAAAIARGLDAVGARPGRLVLVTDLQSTGWTGGAPVAVPERVALDVRDVGPMPPNAGVVAVDRRAGSLRAEVRATGPARTLDVELWLDGTRAGRQRASVPADGQTAVEFTDVTASRGIARVRLATPDGVPADDERWVVLDPQPGVRAVIVASPGAGSADAVYVRRALEAAEWPRTWQVDVRSADRLREAADLAGAAVVMIVGTAGLDRRGAEAVGRFVEQGGGLLVAVGPGVNTELLSTGIGDAFPRVRVGPPLEAPLGLVPTDLRHPAFRLFDPESGPFDAVRVSRAAMLATTAPAHVLARLENGAPALIDQAMGSGRMVVLASDLSNRWNDFVLQPAFVPWLAETAVWLAGKQAAPRDLVAGDTARADAVQPGVAEWRPAGAPPGTPPVRVPVNVSGPEMDPRRMHAPDFLAQVPRDDDDRAAVPAAARRQESEQGWWRYGLGLMLLGLIVESVIGRRG